MPSPEDILKLALPQAAGAVGSAPLAPGNPLVSGSPTLPQGDVPPEALAVIGRMLSEQAHSAAVEERSTLSQPRAPISPEAFAAPPPTDMASAGAPSAEPARLQAGGPGGPMVNPQLPPIAQPAALPPAPVPGLGDAPLSPDQIAAFAALPTAAAAAPAAAGTSAAAVLAPTPPREDGAEAYRDALRSVVAKEDKERLEALRGSGLSDEQIKRGDTGTWGPAGEMTRAIAEEQAGIERIAQAKSQEARLRAREMEVQREAESLQGQQQAEEQRAIQEQIDKRSAEITQLSDQYGRMEIKDPWADKGTGERVVAAIAILLGGIGSGLAGGPNIALEVIDSAIERDLAIQESNRAAKGQQIVQQRGLLQEFRAQLGDTREAHALTRERMYREAELQLQVYAERAQTAEAKGNADILRSQLEQRRLLARDQALQAAQERATKDYWETRSRAAGEAVQRLDDPLSQSEALIASGVPELMETGVRLRSTTPEGGARTASTKAQSAIGKIMADYRSGNYGDPETPQAVALVNRAVQNELAGSGMTTDKLAASILLKYQTTKQPMSEEDAGILNFLPLLGGSPQNLVLAGMPMFQGATKSFPTEGDAQPGAPSAPGPAPQPGREALEAQGAAPGKVIRTSDGKRFRVGSDWKLTEVTQ